MTARFTVIGDVMVDITARIRGQVSLGSDTDASISLQAGGAAANTARWLAHEGHAVSLVAAIGTDALADSVLKALSLPRLTLILQTCSDRATGACVVIVDETGQRTMLPDSGANDLLDDGGVPDSAFSGAHVHLSGYTLLNPASRQAGLALLRRARSLGCTMSLDPASAAPIRDRGDAVRSALGLVDLVVANLDEAAILMGTTDPVTALDRLAEHTPTAVVKLGGDGAIAKRGSEQASAPAIPATVVDTTGAGDAFAAGFLPSWLADEPLASCLASANAVAAQAVARVGAGPPTSLA